MSVELISKYKVLQKLKDGEELIMVDFDRMIVRNVYTITFPLIKERIESKNVFFFERVDE